MTDGLTGALVTLRAQQESDADALYEIAAELDTWELRNASPPRPVSRPEFLESFTKSITSNDGDAWLAIEADGALIGRCGLFHIDHLARTAEVGIGLQSAARGRGYGTDALRVLARLAFDRHNLRRLHLVAIQSNVGGLACYRKVGFVEEGRRREHCWVQGRYEDEVIMGLLRSDWTP
jgi:RimJ/RimL family protein N-acetyltransferase